MKQKLKIQIGVESKSTPLRLTPIDQIVDLDDTVELVIEALVMQYDLVDGSPDGEADIPLKPAVIKALAAKIPFFGNLVAGIEDANVFLKIKRVQA
jgi:hypothetical protein